jgi:type IV fimbrial biogenesis protein FimT
MKKYLLIAHSSRQSGMTFIELIITMSIFAIITSIALPSMTDFFSRKSIEAIGPFFERTIKLARVEASQRSVDVRVRPTSGTDDWSQGWYIEFTDASDGNKIKIIKTFDALEGTITFTSNTFDDTTQLTISPTGQTNTTGRFDLYHAPCVAGEGFEFNLFLSGIMNKGLITCNPN